MRDINALREQLLQDNNDSKLPLEYFDAEDYYEVHSPEDWLTLHQNQFTIFNGENGPGIEVQGCLGYSRYLYKNSLLLQPCVVMSYNEDRQTFRIKWITKNSKMFSQSTCTSQFCRQTMKVNRTAKDFIVFDDPSIVVPLGSENQKTVKRLNLLFADESEAMWWRRREAARAARR